MQTLLSFIVCNYLEFQIEFFVILIMKNNIICDLCFTWLSMLSGKLLLMLIIIWCVYSSLVVPIFLNAYFCISAYISLRLYYVFFICRKLYVCMHVGTCLYFLSNNTLMIPDVAVIKPLCHNFCVSLWYLSINLKFLLYCCQMYFSFCLSYFVSN